MVTVEIKKDNVTVNLITIKPIGTLGNLTEYTVEKDGSVYRGTIFLADYIEDDRYVNLLDEAVYLILNDD